MGLETSVGGDRIARRASRARRILEAGRIRLAALGPWWHLLFFVGVWLLLQDRFVRQVRRALVLFVLPDEARRLMLNGPFTEDTSWSAMLDFVNFGAVLAAVWVMSWIERRRPAHGLPLDGHAASGFGAGALLGLGAMSLCAGGLWASGALRIGGVLQPIGHAVLSGTLWAVALCAVALFEESLFRGYALRTLGSAIRFWPAAVVLSALFAAAHVGNPGENAAGLVAIFAFGLVFSLLVRRAASLWTAVGFHLGWNWAESFLFGVPDSGVVSRGRLVEGTLQGPAWLTGGTAGPEASVMSAAALVLVALVVLFLCPAGKGSRTALEAGSP
jgi:membrane protease YdiL (CAAX protease family)